MRCFSKVASLALAAFAFGCGNEDAGPGYGAQVVDKLNESRGPDEFALLSAGPHEISECLMGVWSFSSPQDGYTGTGYFSAHIGNRCSDPIVIWGISANGGGGGSLRAQSSAGTVEWCSWNPEWNGIWQIIYLQPGEILGVGSALKPDTLSQENGEPLGQINITWPKPNGPKPGANCRSIDSASWIMKTYDVELSDQADTFLSAELLDNQN